MRKSRSALQRGAADLVTVAVGLTILAIAAVGTSYSLVYGREALIQQEHYRVALYELRGFMEREMAKVKLLDEYRRPERLLDDGKYTFYLDSWGDRDGNMKVTPCEIWRERIDAYDDFTTGLSPDYFRITAYAAWQEPVVAGYNLEASDMDGPQRAITLTTTFRLPQ
ncbi:hypothetical protein IT157_10725 [bacterium]|jgi:hypothetical protein|nr:hypothetical protein [bacterium]